jgi:hypothetical protein
MDYGDDEDEELRAAIAASARGASRSGSASMQRRHLAFWALRASASAR